MPAVGCPPHPAVGTFLDYHSGYQKPAIYFCFLEESIVRDAIIHLQYQWTIYKNDFVPNLKILIHPLKSEGPLNYLLVFE